MIALPNVLITGHQAFFTNEALTTIAGTMVQSLTDFAAGRGPEFSLTKNG